MQVALALELLKSELGGALTKMLLLVIAYV